MQVLRKLSAISVIVFCSASAIAAAAQQAGPQIRITAPIDDNQLVPLKGTVSPLVSARNDLGAIAADRQLNRIQFLLKRSPAQESALSQLLQDQNNPGSPNYHKWLTPDQFGKQFGPSDQDIATISNWLTSHGFQVKGVTPGKQILEFSGTEGQFSSTFHSQIHQYSVNGEKRFANATDPQIPAALTPVIRGFASLNNLRITPASHSLGKAAYDPNTGQATPSWTTGQGKQLEFPVSPGDLAVQYDIAPVWNSGVTGAQQNIAIIGNSNIDVAQVNLFRKLFGLPYNPPQVIIDGADPGIDGINAFDSQGEAMEAYLDTEWAGAMAPNATIDLVIAADTILEPGVLLAGQHAVFSDVAPIISVSFFNCEAQAVAANQAALIETLWEEAAAQGITVLVGSGNSGSANCDDPDYAYASSGAAVNAFASTPFNVAVGGTDFYYSDYKQSQGTLDAQLATYWNTTPENGAPAASMLKPVPEQAWNNSQYGFNILAAVPGIGIGQGDVGGSGGGPSQLWPKPAWQVGAGVPDDKARDLPDVSLFAGFGTNLSFYPICANDGDCQPASNGTPVQITAAGGTSASVQVFAGLMALVNQQYGPQGQANNVLYPLATQFPKAFNDITVGTNSEPCDLSDGTPDCIAVANPVTSNGITEGQIGSGTTPWYNAAAGYDLATGLGSIDFNQLFTNWGKISFASTKTTLQLSSTSVAHGTPVTFSGSVTTAGGTPAGVVVIQTDHPGVNSAVSGGFALDQNGNYSGQKATLPGGTYDVWARYSGDTGNGPSTSTRTQVTVTPEASTNVIFLVGPSGSGTPANPIPPQPYGSALLLNSEAFSTAYYNNCIVNANPPASCQTSAPNQATGSVTFTDNGKSLATTNVASSGLAEVNTGLGVGKHLLVANYSGDESYEPSTSGAIPITIVKETPFLIFEPCSNEFVGEPCALQVVLENQTNGQYDQPGEIFVSPVLPPTGVITITGGPKGMPTSVPLISNSESYSGQPSAVAVTTIPGTIPAGTYNISLNYAGDANYTATSFQTSFTVDSAPQLLSTTTAKVNGTFGAAGSGGSLNVTVTGQPGHPAPTGYVVITWNPGFQFVNITPGSGDSSTYTWTPQQQFLTPGTIEVQVEYSGDTVYLDSSTNVTFNNDQSDFSMQTTTPKVAIAAGGSGTATINLASENGFAGALTLSCQAAPGVTCSIPSSATLAAGGTSSAALTIAVPAESANLSYNVGVTATDSTGAYAHTRAVLAQVSGSAAGSQSFVLTSNLQSMTLTAGVAANNTGTINVWGLGGFSGAVALNCTVTDNGVSQVAPSCIVDNAQLNVSGGNPQTTNIIINTIGSAGSSQNRSRDVFWAASGGLALGLLVLIGVPRRRKWLSLLCLLAAMVALGTVGCSHFNMNNLGSTQLPGTTPGGYTVTVTGTLGQNHPKHQLQPDRLAVSAASAANIRGPSSREGL